MPFTVRLDQPLEDDRHFVLFVASCPLSAKETRNFTWNARNYDLDPARDQGFVDFQQVILEQDRVVVESQRPEELPIDLSEELHIKGVDRVSIDYRRWLGEIAAAEMRRESRPRNGERRGLTAPGITKADPSGRPLERGPWEPERLSCRPG